MLNKTLPQALFGISNAQSVIFPGDDAVHNSFRGACEVFMNDKLRFSSNIPDGVLVHFTRFIDLFPGNVPYKVAFVGCLFNEQSDPLCFCHCFRREWKVGK